MHEVPGSQELTEARRYSRAGEDDSQSRHQVQEQRSAGRIEGSVGLEFTHLNLRTKLLDSQTEEQMDLCVEIRFG